MAEYFWAGSIKNPQDFAPLVARAWREEWLVLGTTAEAVEAALSELSDSDIDPAAIAAQLELSDSPAGLLSGVVSGVARREGWSVGQAAAHLVHISQEAIDRLIDGGVLKAKRTPSGATYELVHDGFGPAFVAWAEDQWQTPLDVLAATTAQRGLEFNWDNFSGVVENACWRGCWVGPTRPDRQLVFENVEFIGCDFRGTLFDRCVFRGGKFRDCDLDLVVFQSCVFEPLHAQPLSFEQVRASGLTIHGGSARNVRFIADTRLYKMWWAPNPSIGGDPDDLDLADIDFEDCTIVQWTVDNVKIEGPIRFRRCSVALSDLLGLSSGSASVELGECRFLYSPVNVALAEAIQRGDGNRVYPEIVEDWQDLSEGGIPVRGTDAPRHISR
jgi:hypothetical protein